MPRKAEDQTKPKLERIMERQAVLKQLLIRVRNGGMITPVIYQIEQLYNPTKGIKPNGS